MAEVTVAEIAAKKSLNCRDWLDLKHLTRQHARERQALKDARKRVEELPRDEASVRQSGYAWLLREEEEAESSLRRKSQPVAQYILAFLLEEQGKLDDALESASSAAANLKSEAEPALLKARVLRRLGKLADARKELSRVQKQFGPDARVHAELGRCAEDEFDLEKALDFYEKALELDPKEPEALFHSAFIFDLRGDDDRAIERYEECASKDLSYANALVNLGLSYEDKGDYERAIICFKTVVRARPNDARARLCLAGAIESTEEAYDEVERKEAEKLELVLRTPVTDFELSVRSRNCFSKMNVRTLGDLVRKTEQELLAFRNFGERSLKEIRKILAEKGLRLGMGREAEERRVRRERLKLIMKEGDSEIINKPVSEIDLSVRGSRAVARIGAKTLGDLVTKSDEELLAVKNFGQTSLNEVKRKLAEYGLSLRSKKGEAED